MMAIDMGLWASLLMLGLIGMVAQVQRGISVAKGGTATGGKASSGVAVRSYEGDVASVDTATVLNAFGGQTQTMIVPQGAAFIESIDIDMSLDLGASAVSVRGHSQVRLTGQGVKNGLHDFNGPAMSVQGVTSGNAIAQGSKTHQNLMIPVVAGADIQIYGYLIGEDPGDATISVQVKYLLA